MFSLGISSDRIHDLAVGLIEILPNLKLHTLLHRHLPVLINPQSRDYSMWFAWEECFATTSTPPCVGRAGREDNLDFLLEKFKGFESLP